MAIIASQPQGDKGSFRHITIFKTDAASTPFALTKGEFVVTEIFAWNQENDHIYYAANLEGSSESKHIYSIKAEEGAKPECMTCSLDSGTGKYWDAEFSKDATNVVLSNQGPNVPRTGVYSVGANGKVGFIQPWEDNQEFNAVISGKALPSVKYDEIDLENGFTAKVRLQLPPNLDESKKYPMLVDVYGGPDSYAVTHKFDIGWGGFLVSNKSYIYAKIDGRGSGLRGDKLLHTIYNKLGTVEIEDQITTAKKLTEKYSFIDASKVGIWGWSYGGYASGQALVQDKNHVFQCAASVAPVTDWLLYGKRKILYVLLMKSFVCVLNDFFSFFLSFLFSQTQFILSDTWVSQEIIWKITKQLNWILSLKNSKIAIIYLFMVHEMTMYISNKQCYLQRHLKRMMSCLEKLYVYIYIELFIPQRNLLF